MVRPDAKRIGVLEDFDPGDQEPLELPDGGRLWVDIRAIADAEHAHGPAGSGTVWARVCKVQARRRRGSVVLRDVQYSWVLQKEPTSDHELRALLPVIKESDGVFLPIGITMSKVWWQDYPGSDQEKAWIKNWAEGAPWQRLRPQIMERLHAQLAANTALKPPEPGLPEEELQPFPFLFHPWLRFAEDGIIRLDENAAAPWPDIIEKFREWESMERRHEKEWTVDPRLTTWPVWKELPPHLRPWFGWCPSTNSPGPLDLPRKGAYEAEMCRRATRWWNEWFISQLHGHERSS